MTDSEPPQFVSRGRRITTRVNQSDRIGSTMAYYLVRAVPREGQMRVLEQKLDLEVFDPIRPFGSAMAESLRRARVDEEGLVWWEEEDYCDPPLAEEREAVLDHYFAEIEVEQVAQGMGWDEIEDLPRLFPEKSV